MPLADQQNAVAQDKQSGKALTDYFLEETLADPMIRHVMQADGVAESDLRNLRASRPGRPMYNDSRLQLEQASPEHDVAAETEQDRA